jgi:hypothetical protein
MQQFKFHYVTSAREVATRFKNQGYNACMVMILCQNLAILIPDKSLKISSL